MTAREALLRWARRSTARYPGVRVTDFTGSWRDGLAFSALIHRNRPDLVDWRNARASQPRERLDRVFNVAEREYGVTRLLDPEGNNNDNRRPSRPSRRPSFPSPLLLRCSLPPPPLPPLSPLSTRVCVYMCYIHQFPLDDTSTVTLRSLFSSCFFSLSLLSSFFLTLNGRIVFSLSFSIF